MVREEPTPAFYVPLAQWPSSAGVLHVRLAGDPSARIAELRRAVAAVNPAVPVTRAHTLVDQIERNVSDERMAMTIGLTLALVALLLATAGLYSTMAFLVGLRTREIGVRVALGAKTRDIRSLVMKEGLMLTFVGVAAGLVLSTRSATCSDTSCTASVRSTRSASSEPGRYWPPRPCLPPGYRRAAPLESTQSLHCVNREP